MVRKEIKDRMDGLIQYNHIDELLITTKEICEGFIEEGFDPEDIKAFLHEKIDNVVNYTKELPYVCRDEYIDSGNSNILGINEENV